MPSNDPVPAVHRCAARANSAGRANHTCSDGDPARFEMLVAWLDRRSIGARMGLIAATSMLLWGGIVVAFRAALSSVG